MEIELSRSAARFIAKRYEGRVYVWRNPLEAPAWLGSRLEVTDAPPPTHQGEFWRHDAGKVLVFVADDVVPPDDESVLALFLRRRSRTRVVATWATRSGLLSDLLNALPFVLWPR